MLGLPPYDGSIISAARHFFLFLGLAYPVLIAIMMTPQIQSHFVFQHKLLPLPLFARLDMPEKYSLAPGKTANLYVPTSDNITLGAWFILNDPYHQHLLRTSSSQTKSLPPSLETIQDAISHRPTVLFLHGAAATRAVEWRVKTYLGFTSRLHVNVLAPDYRGFGDSTGSPSTEGLVLDAYASWRWLIEEGGAKPEDVIIVGHSLGTGVAGQLARRLAEEGVEPRGVVLLAPFTSISKLLETYSILGVPILQPMQTFSLGIKLMKYFIRHDFDTLSAIQDFNAPTLIAHSQDDFDIPYSHSRTLIDKLLEPFLPEQTIQLPTSPGASLSSEDFAAFTKSQQDRRAARSTLVRKTEIPNFGVVEEFVGSDASDLKVVYVETFWGAHAKVGAQEGVQDEIGKLFKLL